MHELASHLVSQNQGSPRLTASAMEVKMMYTVIFQHDSFHLRRRSTLAAADTDPFF